MVPSVSPTPAMDPILWGLGSVIFLVFIWCGCPSQGGSQDERREGRKRFEIDMDDMSMEKGRVRSLGTCHFPQYGEDHYVFGKTW